MNLWWKQEYTFFHTFSPPTPSPTPSLSSSILQTSYKQVYHMHTEHIDEGWQIWSLTAVQTVTITNRLANHWLSAETKLIKRLFTPNKDS